MSLRARMTAALSLRDTPIGAGVSRPVAAAMTAIALVAVAIDLRLLPPLAEFDYTWERAAPSLVVIAGFAAVLRDRHALGVRVVPLPSARYWLLGTVGMAVLFAVIVGVTFAIYIALHGAVWPPQLPPPSLGHFERSFVQAPLWEELVYRWVLVTGLAALGLRWTAVVISGLAFGYLHLRYGSPAPNNVAAGFVFAWMYLRSGSIALPVAFHSLGNFAVAALNFVGHAVLAH